MTDCPTPLKKRFHTKKEAKQALLSVWVKHRRGGRSGRLQPYRCECGSWHLGHLAAEVISGLLTRADVYPKKGKAA